MIGLLVSLLVLVVVIYVFNLIVGMLNLPEQVKQIVYIIFGLIVVLYLLGQVGVIPTYGPYPILR